VGVVAHAWALPACWPWLHQHIAAAGPYVPGIPQTPPGTSQTSLIAACGSHPIASKAECPGFFASGADSLSLALGSIVSTLSHIAALVLTPCASRLLPSPCIFCYTAPDATLLA
jgi:hypothetical protein